MAVSRRVLLIELFIMLAFTGVAFVRGTSPVFALIGVIGITGLLIVQQYRARTR